MKYQHKRGTTFDHSGPLVLLKDNLQLTNMDGWTGACQVRQPASSGGTLVAQIEFTWLDVTLSLARLRMQDTSNWPLGNCELDIKLTNANGDTAASCTVPFDVVNWVTQ